MNAAVTSRNLTILPADQIEWITNRIIPFIFNS